MKKSAKFKKIIGIVNCSSPYLIIHLESKFEETIYAELSSDSFPIHHAKLMMGQELLFDRDDGHNQLARILPFTRQKPEFISKLISKLINQGKHKLSKIPVLDSQDSLQEDTKDLKNKLSFLLKLESLYLEDPHKDQIT